MIGKEVNGSSRTDTFARYAIIGSSNFKFIIHINYYVVLLENLEWERKRVLPGTYELHTSWIIVYSHITCLSIF